MPLSLASRMVLRATISPSASNETIAVVAVFSMMLPQISPAAFSSQIALRPLPVISQSRILRLRPPRQWTRPRRSGRGMPPPESVRLLIPIWSAPSLVSSDVSPVNISVVAPRVPMSCEPLASRSSPVR